MKILFISEETLKQNTSLQFNIDSKLLTNLIWESQNIYIHSLVGTALYNELITQVSGSTVTSANATLLNEYVIPTLQAYVKFEAPIEISFKFANSALLKQTPENTESISLDDMFRIRSVFKNKAEWFAERLKDFLCANTSTYPLYINPGNTSDTIKPSNSGYETGMYLD